MVVIQSSRCRVTDDVVAPHAKALQARLGKGSDTDVESSV